MRTPEQNEALRAATLETVESAAVRAFARHGFAATSMRQIANEAGLSVGSIYRHHANKEALFAALLDRAAAGLGAAAATLRSADDPFAAVSDFTRNFLADLHRTHGAAEFYMVINQGFLSDTPAGTAERLASDQRALWRAFAELVHRGQITGQFASGNPVQLTAHYFAMLSGLATMRAVLPRGRDDSSIELVLRILTNGVLRD